MNKINHERNILDIPGVANIRDIGGYKAENGKTVRTGRFIRSAALSGMTAAGEKALASLGVDCVIDLRSTGERERFPDSIENSAHIHYAHVPMLDHISSSFVTGNFTDFPASMAEMYIGLLEMPDDSFKRIFALFADSAYRAYVFHCTAGKDRTGVTAMLLLSLAGVPDEIIISDYAYTEVLLGTGPLTERPPDLPGYLFEAKPATMHAAISHIRAKYGDVAGYLLRAGVDEETQRLVREKLI